MEADRVDAAREERDLAEKATEKTEKQLLVEKKEKAYLLSTRRTLSPDADGLIHTIKFNSVGISEGVDNLIRGLGNDDYSKDEILTRLTRIKLYAIKNLKMAELATRSGFDQDIAVRSVDVVKYILEYIDIYKSVFSESEMSFRVGVPKISFVRNISVLNLSIVLDNFISNAEKWGAKLVKIDFVEIDNFLEMFVSDDGVGLSDLFIDNPENVFKLGARDIPPEDFEGSGIGLYYSRSLMNDMNGEIFFVGNKTELSGATFKVVFA
jgi:light-regulated signal transduction histidine kinase (bacteriophytochrome)